MEQTTMVLDPLGPPLEVSQVEASLTPLNSPLPLDSEPGDDYGVDDSEAPRPLAPTTMRNGSTLVLGDKHNSSRGVMLWSLY